MISGEGSQKGGLGPKIYPHLVQRDAAWQAGKDVDKHVDEGPQVRLWAIVHACMYYAARN